MKNKKLIGLASLMLTLGATGCPKKTEPCEKHTWGDKVVLKEATCTEAGESERTCTVCGEKEEKKPIKALGHDWKDGAVAKEATCTEKGSKNQTCSRCNATQTADIPALGHNYVDDEEGLVPATCEAAGSKNQHCSRCNDPKTGVEIPALGHKYENYVTTVEATCEAPGKKVAQCENGCGKTDEQTINALGHKPVTDDTDEPEPGKAAVRVYHCDNGCGQTFLGFKASEVTDASKARLTIGTDGGASFWGRPIGNSLALTEDGTSKNQQNNECVYCRDEQGDFFEYVFDLTAAQAATLGSCRLYCDAMPANYLTGDFWAYNGSSTDWTPGYYIDDEDEHIEKNEDGTTKMVKNHTVVERTDRNPGDEKDEEVPMGKRITNYRYVLYVDGKVKDFDPDTHVEVEANTRKEYVLPYTFNLHEGENRISLRMAGGYRSTFYNFTFRPYNEKTPITVDQATLELDVGATANITGASQEGVTYTSSNEAVATVDANGVVTGVKAGTAEITVAKEGDFKPAKVAVTVNAVVPAHEHVWANKVDVAATETTVAYTREACACGTYKITINAADDMNGKLTAQGGKLPKGSSGSYDGTAVAKYVFNMDFALEGTFYADGGVDNAGNYGLNFHTGKVNGTNGALSDGKTNTVFKINDANIEVCEDAYNTLVDLNGTLSTSNVNDTSKVRHGLIKIGDGALVEGENKFEMAATDSYGIGYVNLVFIGKEAGHHFGEATDVTEGASDAAVKKYVCACGAVKYEIDVKTAQMQLAEGSAWKNDPSSGAFKLNKDGHSASFTFALPKGFVGKMYQRAYMDSYNSQKTKSLYYATDNVANIEVKVNGDAIDMEPQKEVTFGQAFGDEVDGSNSTVKEVLIGDVTLAAANTISYKRVKTLNMIVSAFVFIGTEVAE